MEYVKVLTFLLLPSVVFGMEIELEVLIPSNSKMLKIDDSRVTKDSLIQAHNTPDQFRLKEYYDSVCLDILDKNPVVLYGKGELELYGEYRVLLKNHLTSLGFNKQEDCYKSISKGLRQNMRIHLKPRIEKADKKIQKLSCILCTTSICTLVGAITFVSYQMAQFISVYENRI
jgi:hypothetical protein